jgi:hypothetical protein
VDAAVDENTWDVEHSDCVEEARNMAEQTTPKPSEDPGHPYMAPTVDFSDPWSDGPADALALRRAHRREESFVKGLAIANFLYTLFFGTGAVYELSILIGHLAGRVDAPPRSPPHAACGFGRRSQARSSCSRSYSL